MDQTPSLTAQVITSGLNLSGFKSYVFGVLRLRFKIGVLVLKPRFKIVRFGPRFRFYVLGPCFTIQGARFGLFNAVFD